MREELESVRCEYCSTSFAVPADVRARARAYLGQVRAAWANEIEALLIAIMHASAARSNPTVLRWLIVVALAAPFWIIMLASGAVEIFPPYLIAVCVLVTLLGIARMTAGLTGPARPPSVALVVATNLGECRACGGPVPIEEGVTACRCRYCGATSVPTADQKREMLGSAVRRVAPAQSEALGAFDANVRSATEASAVLPAFGKANSATVITIILILGSLALTAFTIYVVLNVDRPDVRRYEAGWVTPTLIVGFCAICAFGTVKVRRLSRAKAEFEKVMGRKIRPMIHRG